MVVAIPFPTRYLVSQAVGRAARLNRVYVREIRIEYEGLMVGLPVNMRDK
jgi:hypothetical protein